MGKLLQQKVLIEYRDESLSKANNLLQEGGTGNYVQNMKVAQLPDGQEDQLKFKVGDLVIVHRAALTPANEIKIDGIDYYMVAVNDILFVH